MENNSSQNSTLREQLLVLLNRCDLEVVFTKKDGTERTMLCTLDCPEVREYFNSMTEENKEREKKKNPEVMNVWDIQAKAWRAFNINSLISYKVYE